MQQDEVRRLWRIYEKDIIRDVDGYFVYWPSPRNAGQACHNAFSLRQLAQLLDFVNNSWDARISRYFKKNWPPVAPEGSNGPL